MVRQPSRHVCTQKTLQVSCVQLHWAQPLARNLEHTLHFIRLAAEEGSRVALFPETSLTGYYFPDVLQLAEAGWYQEEMITAVLDLDRADRSYALDSLNDPPFLKPYWEQMLKAVEARADQKPA